MKGKNHDNDLQVRPGRIRSRGAGTRPKTFFAEVLKAGRKAGFSGFCVSVLW